ncbi:MAG TPA: carbohydrate porin, partial [Planctomycetaceae bacterium]|nr:carbohydrate porin [Planctomycetaceae bacterium]
SKDYFGIGWYQVGTSDELNPITAAALNLGLQGQGIELYYRIQATEHVQITPDIQINDPARNGIDTAYLFGVRALMSF